MDAEHAVLGEHALSHDASWWHGYAVLRHLIEYGVEHPSKQLVMALNRPGLGANWTET